MKCSFYCVLCYHVCVIVVIRLSNHMLTVSVIVVIRLSNHMLSCTCYSGH